MTRRIAITILLTVWIALIGAGLTAWLTARSVLLHDLDSEIVERARMLTAGNEPAAIAAAFPGDRYIVKGRLDRTLDRPGPVEGTAAEPEIINADFVRLPEGSFRRLTLRTPDDGTHEPSTIVYSASTTGFDRVLQRLAIALAGCAAAGGAIAAVVAARLARIALRPLSHAAATVAEVNDRTLDRRIDEASLPPELRPMATQLNEMLGRLQGAFEQRRRFLADASHELRTPIAAMITTMEVALRKPRPAAELTENLQICLDEARHMRQLVQALFRQIRAEGQSAAGEFESLDASEMVARCTELAQSLAAERNVRLVLQTHAKVPIFTEPTRLRSILMNLMSNAIEYIEPGGVVEVSASAENGAARITIKDNGPGIAAEHLPHLFEPFYRVSSSRNADGHLGLGLFLVGSHIKAMGGECRVDSQVGRGTVFSIRLPSSELAVLAGGAKS
jgi:signal transduction histidine kinase